MIKRVLGVTFLTLSLMSDIFLRINMKLTLNWQITDPNVINIDFEIDRPKLRLPITTTEFNRVYVGWYIASILLRHYFTVTILRNRSTCDYLSISFTAFYGNLWKEDEITREKELKQEKFFMTSKDCRVPFFAPKKSRKSC